MSHRVTVRLGSDLAAWLENRSARTGISKSQLIRELLEGAMSKAGDRGFLRLAGTVRGTRDLSVRRGFSPR